MKNLDSVLAQADANLDASLQRLADFVRIPSISTDPTHAPDCVKAANWITSELKSIGFKAEARKTKGQPMVVAKHSPKSKSKVHALFYGHYDVQPVDPLNLWTTPPFEATRKQGDDGAIRIHGRGTADDKGQLLTFVEAARAWMAVRGELPIAATFLLEGEEESGSPSLNPFLKANAKELSCDIAFVCDTNMWDAKTPAVTTRLRGLVHEEITITGPSIDLHSGMYGGPAINPIRVLAKLLAGLHDKSGKVTIPGFYDGVPVLSAATKKQWTSLKFSDKKFLGDVGLTTPAGEKSKSVLEQIWARPTAEVNGIWGGYTGAGTKTVIPSQAHAKLTFRLVGKQDADKILKTFQGWAKKQLPLGAKIRFSGRGGGAPASEIAEHNTFITRSAQALGREFQREAVLIGSGGSIPIVRSFKDILGMDSVLIGFGLSDDAIHSPNEKYNLSSFHKGIRSWIRIMDALAV
jgi:acetylornithine deacetylase/succinyl-diaminopimelate desuccinylase-like protein